MALRPGELVMLDSTPLDVLAVLDDGVTGRAELSIALDVATRSICAAVLRPVGTTSVDAAMLLAQMVVPTAMRPGWAEALSMQRSVIPYERLIALDARLEQAAARPVIMPETVIVDQGRVYGSASFVSACESLGVSVQPVPPANGAAKGNVERTFRAIADGFSQYLPGHTGTVAAPPATDIHLSAEAAHRLSAFARIPPAHLTRALARQPPPASIARWQPVPPAVQPLPACTACTLRRSPHQTAPAWIHPAPNSPRILIRTRHQQASSDSRHPAPPASAPSPNSPTPAPGPAVRQRPP
ncbi:hypothetical protein [Streptomyces sp. NPDC019793]|uniref:hypothetical protein n=1 Tax=unclassified Streptomyces TaxID=2593676 RepID=UPI0033FC8ECB